MKELAITVAFIAVVVGLASLIAVPKTQATNPGYQTFQYVK